MMMKTDTDILTVRVYDDDLAVRFTSPDAPSHQRVECQFARESGLHRPADHDTGEGIDNHRQIQPALPGKDIGNIGDPDLLGQGNSKRPLHTIRGNNGRSAGDTAWYLRLCTTLIRLSFEICPTRFLPQVSPVSF